MKPLVGLFGLVLVLALAWTTPATSTQPVGKKSPSTVTLPPPSRPEMLESEWLPKQAREMLTARMLRHSDDMMLLLGSVVVLAHEDAQEIAEQIASEPRIGRAAPGEVDTLNALLPARFFELQDQMRDRAQEVAAAAKAKNNARMAKACGRLAETCVACHSVYLRNEPVATEEPE